MCAGFRFDQLRSDPHPPTCFAHRAFQHVAHAEFAPDLFHINYLALVSDARIAGDHEQPADAGEGGDDLLELTPRRVVPAILGISQRPKIDQRSRSLDTVGDGRSR
jgi:hypothetical protein